MERLRSRLSAAIRCLKGHGVIYNCHIKGEVIIRPDNKHLDFIDTTIELTKTLNIPVGVIISGNSGK